MFSRRLKIRLDGGDDQVYRPGSRVSGHVEYKSPVEDRLASVTINLRGVIKLLQGSSVRKEQVELFHFSQDLFVGERTLEPKELFACSFEFILPAMTRLDRTGLYRGREHPLFHEQPQALPPSLSPKQSGHAQVIYGLCATAKRFQHVNGGLDQGRTVLLTAELDSLRFLPENTDLTPLAAQPSERRITLSGRRGWSIFPTRINASRQPKGVIVVVLNAPSMIVLGRDIPISFLVRFEGFENQGSSSPPPCYHKMTSVALEAKTHRRSTSPPYRLKNPEIRLKRLGTDHGYDSEPLATSIQARRFPSDAIHGWSPSFSSYGVARTYDLLVDITITCRNYNQEICAHFRVPNIKAVAPRSEVPPRRPGSLADIASWITYRPPHEDDGDELPPYRPRSVHGDATQRPTIEGGASDV